MFRHFVGALALITTVGCGGARKDSQPPAAGTEATAADAPEAEQSTPAPPAASPFDEWTTKGQFYARAPEAGGPLLCAVGVGPAAPARFASNVARGEIVKVFKTEITVVIDTSGDDEIKTIKVESGATLTGVAIMDTRIEAGRGYALACLDLVALKQAADKDTEGKMFVIPGTTREQALTILDLLIKQGERRAGSGG